MSLPSRERGLKYVVRLMPSAPGSVAPLAGAWIEMAISVYVEWNVSVAPLAGAWIEMLQSMCYLIAIIVAPLAGAWIEILK